ncbi:MAG: hypothetical protein FD153_261 [Rhodospirillaceae bacterium]|nr:MAG: hypothetical protein FD153_261 [Rhodospirillaceae bacterium]
MMTTLSRSRCIPGSVGRFELPVGRLQAQEMGDADQRLGLGIPMYEQEQQIGVDGSH